MTADLPHPATLRSSRVKTVGFLILSLVFVAGAIWMIAADPAASTTGWLTAIFFGVGAIVFAVMLVPGASFLRLEPEGFTVCALFRRSFTPWSTVHRFGVTRIVWRRAVGMNFEPDAKMSVGLRRLNAGIAGFEGALPDTYGMSAAALAELMNEALARARLRPE
jgi:hypothetical protein